MSIDFIRKELKLNTMYPITINDNVNSVNCRINFNIIDFIYLSIVRKNNANKTDYYDRLYDFLDIRESYYEGLRKGKKIDKIKQDKTYRYVKINELIDADASSGKTKLEITGVSTKQWKQYFWICKKYSELNKIGAEKVYIKKAKMRKEQFQKMILRKIDNMEMSEGACVLYRELSNYLFADKLPKLYRDKGDDRIEFIKEISKSELEGLWKNDKNKFNEMHRLVYGLFKQMKEIKEK